MIYKGEKFFQLKKKVVEGGKNNAINAKKRTKYRKLQKGRVRGKAARGNKVSDGELWITSLRNWV